MPSLLPRRGARHVPAALVEPRAPARRKRLALLGVPALVVAAAIIAAPALTSPAAPTATPDAFAGPVVIAPPTATPGDWPLPTATPQPSGAVATPTPTAVVPRSKPPHELDGFVWPLRNARLTSRFGPRDDGNMIVGGERYHDGVDLATWCGDKVRAAHSGTVLYAGRKFDEYLGYSGPLDDFYAYMERIGGLVRWLPIVVVIDYGNGYRGSYAHLSKATVEAGDVVAAGEVIGLEGATGRATGCHLHYALVRMDGAWTSVEPSFVAKMGYPPFIRERVDPLLVFPLADAHAPDRLQRRHRVVFDRRTYTLEPD
jgi:murein DD-endopeptidase MepM/ murein hydrolase activator NlpD